MKQKKTIPTYNDIPITLENLPVISRQLVRVFCSENNIENLATVSSNIFSACIMFIAEHTVKKNPDIFKFNNNCNGAYSMDKLNIALEQYHALCLLYDNAVNMVTFSYYVNMEYTQLIKYKDFTTLRDNTNNSNRINDCMDYEYEADAITGAQLYSKIHTLEEQTTLAMKKYNDLRVIARLNNITKGAYRDYTQVDTLNVDNQTIEQIAQKYKQNVVIAGTNAPELPILDTKEAQTVKSYE